MITTKIYPIGTKMFMVHKKYPTEKLPGGSVIPVRVQSYENNSGAVVPICSKIGQSKTRYSTDMYYLYTDLIQAIQAISTNPEEQFM